MRWKKTQISYFPIFSKNIEIQESIRFNLTTTEVKSINTAGRQAQNIQIFGGLFFEVFYFMQMFGTILMKLDDPN